MYGCGFRFFDRLAECFATFAFRHRVLTPHLPTTSNNNKINKAEWDFSKHWLAITSIILILGAAGVAVPLALRVSSGQYFMS